MTVPRVVGRLDAAVDRLARGAAAIALAAAGLAMFAQVVARYVFAAPFAWAEEFATLMFAWITFVGAAAVQRDDTHLSIDTLRAYVGPRARFAVDLVRRLAIVSCAALLVWQGVALSLRMWSLAFPAMGVSRSWLYLSVPVGFALTLYWAFRTPLAKRDAADHDTVEGTGA